MTRLRLHFLIIVGPSIAQLAFAQPAKQAEEAPTATAEIVEMKFCRGTPAGLFIARVLAPDAISLNLSLRVSFRNAGVTPVILLLTEDKRVVLSRNLEGAARHEDQIVIPYYEFRGPPRPWMPEDLPLLASERPGQEFEVIPPGVVWTGDAFPLSFQVHKPSINEAGSETGSELLGAEVFFQVELVHSFLPESVARELQAKWSRYGNLWAGEVRTQPIKIAIPLSPQASQCASNIRID
jgi:hypothetical protein